MPQVNRTRKIQETLSTVARDGELTINLNLQITLDEGHIVRISADTKSEDAPPGLEGPEPQKKVEIIPHELFASSGDDLLENFGESKDSE